MEKFLIRLEKKIRVDKDRVQVEFVPDNEFELTIKKCDTIYNEEVSDYGYLEQVKIELFDGLEDAYGELFTSNYEL